MLGDRAESPFCADSIVVEGWLRKRSRHRGVYRRRWIVLTHADIRSFRDERCYLDATEVIPLQETLSVSLSADGGTLFVCTTRRAFMLRSPDDGDDLAPSPAARALLLSWFEHVQALRCGIGTNASVVARLPDDILSRIFELLPTSAIAAICTTCRKWRDLRVSLLRRQHQRAASQIEHLWRTDERYHLATLRRHRPRDRSAGASPFFTLHVEHTDELILRADRDLLGRGFVISCPRPRAPGEAGGAEREGGRHGKPLGPLLNATRASVLDDASRMQYVGHLIGTASFATFTMYDHGLPPPMPPSGMRSAPQRYSPEAAGPPPCSTADMARRELAHITLRHSLWAARCISVAIPAEPGAADDAEGAGRERADSADTSELVFAPVSPATPPSTPGAPASPRGSTLAQRARRKEWRLDADAGVQLLHNAVPSWNSDLSAFTLPFYGRVHLASKKNFQLIDRRRPDVVVMIFGKSRRDVYSLDWCHPLSCLQAIGIALSSFDSCLAGRKSG